MYSPYKIGFVATKPCLAIGIKLSQRTAFVNGMGCIKMEPNVANWFEIAKCNNDINLVVKKA